MRSLALVVLIASCSDVAAPTFTSITPTWGSRDGGTRVTIHGAGFSPGLTVRFGDREVPAEIVDDGELVVVAPPGPLAPVAISVGDGDHVIPGPIAYRYLAPLYAADGRRANREAYTAVLYRIDPTDGTSTPIGELDARLTGLAISPDGVLVGVTIGDGRQHLVTIDPYTAKTTDLGVLAQPDRIQRDITFDDFRLHGWNGAAMTTIDRSTQLVTPTPPMMTRGRGNGFASRGGETYLAPELASGALYRVDTATGSAAPHRQLAGPAVPVSSMTFVGDRLLAALNTSATGVTLAQVDPETGAVRAIGTLPARVDAIAGIAAE